LKKNKKRFLKLAKKNNIANNITFKKNIMTPKEKAKELVYIFSFHCSTCDYEDYGKKYALIAVDEILEECRLEKDWYWEEVKQEIEKL
jgi:hypothetical protein